MGAGFGTITSSLLYSSFRLFLGSLLSPRARRLITMRKSSPQWILLPFGSSFSPASALVLSHSHPLLSGYFHQLVQSCDQFLANMAQMSENAIRYHGPLHFSSRDAASLLAQATQSAHAFIPRIHPLREIAKYKELEAASQNLNTADEELSSEAQPTAQATSPPIEFSIVPQDGTAPV